MTIENTKPMRRVRHSAPRVRSRLFLPILFLVGIDFGLIGLAVVLYLTPVHPNYPQNTGPILTPHAPQVVAPAVPLPVRSTAAYKPSTAPRRTAVTHRPAPSHPKTSASRTAIPSPVTPTVAVTTTQPPSLSTTPTPIGSGD